METQMYLVLAETGKRENYEPVSLFFSAVLQLREKNTRRDRIILLLVPEHGISWRNPISRDMVRRGPKEGQPGSWGPERAHQNMNFSVGNHTHLR